MRLPSHLVALLSASGLALSCEHPPPQKTEHCTTPAVVDDTPLDEVVRMTHEVRPAVAPLPKPPPQPQPQLAPQPAVKPKPPPRKVWTSICGHAPELVDASAPQMRCGRG